MMDNQIAVALDMGDLVTRVLIGEIKPDGSIEYPGWSSRPSEGIYDGIIVNIEAARNCIQSVIDEAELMANRTVREIRISLSGFPVDSFHSRGIVAKSRQGGEIGQDDIDRAMEGAKTVALPSDRSIIHVLPCRYSVDYCSDIRNPLNRVGQRLEVEVHIVTAAIAAVDNIKAAIERTDITVCAIHHGTLASSQAVLSENESEQGVILVNIGARWTDFMLVKNGFTTGLGTIPTGGYWVTSDLAKLLDITEDVAEQLKQESANCWREDDENSSVSIPGIDGQGTRSVSTAWLEKLIKPRMEELFSHIQKKIEKLPCEDRQAEYLVLTGGGSLLNGSVDLAHECFRLPARLGGVKPSLHLPVECRDPSWSTVVGMVQIAAADPGHVRGGGASSRGDSLGILKGLWQIVRRVF